MVAAFTTPALLTVYYVGVRLVEYANELLYKAFGFTLPLYTEAVAREDDAELARKVRMFLRLNGIVAGGMLIGAYLFGNDLIRLWMGSDFNSGDAYLCPGRPALGKIAGLYHSALQQCAVCNSKTPVPGLCVCR